MKNKQRHKVIVPGWTALDKILSNLFAEIWTQMETAKTEVPYTGGARQRFFCWIVQPAIVTNPYQRNILISNEQKKSHLQNILIYEFCLVKWRAYSFSCYLIFRWQVLSVNNFLYECIWWFFLFNSFLL